MKGGEIMSLSITLYKMNDNPKKINKTLPTATGTFLAFSTNYLKSAFDVLEPMITLSSTDDLSAYNYMYVGSPVDRYYFIKPTIANTGLWSLNAREDVLQTFQSAILTQSGILDRSENVINTYLSDSIFEGLVYRRICTIPFPTSNFSTGSGSYYLTVTGGS